MRRFVRFTEAGVAALLLLAGGCAGVKVTDTESPTAQPAAAPIIDPAPRAGAPYVLIAMPHSRDFVEVRRGLVPELARSFNVSTFTVRPGTKARELREAIAQKNPACLVVMNNNTVGLLVDLQRENPDRALPPAVIVMTSMVEGVRPLIKNATGIAYEVPGVTSFINLRALMKAPLTKVGVAYRPMFHAFIERQQAMARREQIELVAVQVDKDVSEADLRGALLKLTNEDHVNALWMLNDNGLLKNQDFIEKTWQTVQRTASVPLIVGTSNLVVPGANLGLFGAVPDYEALGLQTANLIFDLSENDWNVNAHDVELPLSVKMIVDLPQLRERFGLREEGLRNVDIVKE